MIAELECNIKVRILYKWIYQNNYNLVILQHYVLEWFPTEWFLQCAEAQRLNGPLEKKTASAGSFCKSLAKWVSVVKETTDKDCLTNHHICQIITTCTKPKETSWNTQWGKKRDKNCKLGLRQTHFSEVSSFVVSWKSQQINSNAKEQ